MWELLSFKGSSISIHIGPAVSFTLGLVGDVPGIIQYMIWFEEQTRTTYFLILWVFLISTEQSFLKNCSVDSQLKSDYWLDFWETPSPVSYFIPWMRTKTLASGIAAAVSSLRKRFCWTCPLKSVPFCCKNSGFLSWLPKQAEPVHS